MPSIHNAPAHCRIVCKRAETGCPSPSFYLTRTHPGSIVVQRLTPHQQAQPKHGIFEIEIYNRCGWEAGRASAHSGTVTTAAANAGKCMRLWRSRAWESESTPLSQRKFAHSRTFRLVCPATAPELEDRYRQARSDSLHARNHVLCRQLSIGNAGLRSVLDIANFECAALSQE